MAKGRKINESLKINDSSGRHFSLGPSWTCGRATVPRLKLTAPTQPETAHSLLSLRFIPPNPSQPPLDLTSSHRDQGDVEGVVDSLGGGVVVHRIADVEHEVGCRRHQPPQGQGKRRRGKASGGARQGKASDGARRSGLRLEIFMSPASIKKISITTQGR